MGAAAKMLELARLFALTYGVLLSCYFASVHAMLSLNRRHPERRIQQHRAARANEERRDRRQSLRSIASFVASTVLFDTWFYWFHRLIHSKPLYRRVHRWYHLCITPTVWVLLAHKIYDQISGVVGHSGFEHGGVLCQPPSPLISTTNHDHASWEPCTPSTTRRAARECGEAARRRRRYRQARAMKCLLRTTFIDRNGLYVILIGHDL